ncbi:MAG TPA: PEP-CTERM sorting domain-containing protein [Phycisphaerae bacterium]|nr:PEP-CTERM sorting domain-containing protein [Phycisphaerae bacterium]HOM53140.1 PEP-CTERM sorting domain-containing protein [Phycisphaerae bacterium]HPP28016.1 PEP-CTERM sorting domain-containing protein [Phycisphaerae bacterium]
MRKFAAVGLVAALAGAPVMALEYEPLVTWAEANAGGTSTALYSAIAEDNTAYCALTLNNSPRFTRVDGLKNPVRTTTELVSTPQWIAAASATTTANINGVTTMYGFSFSGEYLQFADAVTDGIWRVHKNTGDIIPYATRAQIKAHTGMTGEASLGTGGDTAPDGEYAFWEGTSKQILKTNGQGTLITLIDQNTLLSLGGVGCTSIGYDAFGNMYWTDNGKDSVYLRTADGSINTVLQPWEISAVTGNSSINFKDIFPAPDGLVYFQEQSSAHILRFSPDSPATTLEIYLSAQDLLDGPSGGTNVYQLSWYDGRLAFNVHATTGAKGLYVVVPEPATMGLLALGGLCLLRRRSR